jgi:riboflavin synthase
MVFTGIVQEQGVVVEAPPRLVLAAAGIAADARLGDSVAVDGCCLTVTAIDGDRLSFDAVPETLRRSTLGALEPGSPVNLEPALRAGDRMGGHLVQGHVDAVGRLESALEEGEAVNMRFAATNDVMRYVIEKGSICVNGISLTVTAFDEQSFSVSIIPHTLQVTNLGSLREGGRVNLESDLIGKYIERLLPAQSTVLP